MPDVSPFRGVRYDVARVGTLSDVVAPPYDVIDAALQDRLYESSPYNIVRLELNRQEPGDATADDRYTRATRFLKDWLRQSILREEDHTALYVYQQTFEVEGKTTSARDFWRGSDWSRLARGRSFPTSRPSPAPKPTGWPSTRQPASTSAQFLDSIPTLTGSCSERSNRAYATARPWLRPTISVSRTDSGSSPIKKHTR